MDPEPLIDGDVVELTFHHVSQNLRVQDCVRHWRVVTLVDEGPVEASFAADTLSLLWGQYIYYLLPESHTYIGASLRTVAPVYSDQIDSLDGATVGVLASDPLPPATALCLVLAAESAPPRRNGRVYLPSAAVESSDANGLPTDVYLADVNNVAIFLTDPSGVTDGDTVLAMVPVVWSELDGVAYDITACRVSKRFGSQRRRGGFWAPLPPL